MTKVAISKTRRIIALVLFPILLLIGINLFVGLNLGVEYTSANIISIQLSKESNYDDVSKVFKELKIYSKFEGFDNNSYKVYYQNVSLEDLSKMKGDLEAQLGTLNTFEVLSYKPTTLVMISDRIFYGTYAVVVIYLAYLAYVLKDSGITRDRLIGIIVTDIVLLVFQLLMIVGLVNLIGLSSYKITPMVITFCLGTLMLSVLPNILLTHDFSENYRSDIIGGWEDSSKSFTTSKLRILVMIGIGFMLFTAVGVELLSILPVIVIGFSYSLFLYLYAKPILLDWIIRGLKSNRFISNNKLLRKEW